MAARRAGTHPTNRVPEVLALAACGWSALIVLLAAVLPIRTTDDHTIGPQPRHSLLHDFGARALLLAAGPLLVCALVAVLLRSTRSGRGRGATAAWLLSAGLLLAALAGTVTFLIGIFVVPSAALLVAACASSRSRSAAEPAEETARAADRVADQAT